MSICSENKLQNCIKSFAYIAIINNDFNYHKIRQAALILPHKRFHYSLLLKSANSFGKQSFIRRFSYIRLLALLAGSA